jgi:hypothetical protein
VPPRKGLGPVSAPTENGPRIGFADPRNRSSHKPNAADPQASIRTGLAGQASSAQVANAARALIDAVIAARHSQKIDEKFFAAAGGVDRDRIVRCAAMVVQFRLKTTRPREAIEAELQREIARLFGAKNLATLEPRGSA